MLETAAKPNKIRKVSHLIGNILITLGVLFFAVAYGPLLFDEVWYWLKVQRSQDVSLKARNGVEDSVFARFLTSSPIKLVPVNTDFSIVIEKIGVNAPVVKDITVIDEQRYNEALKSGIAHASISDYPSQDPSNVYLFAHSSLNFWELGKYAKVFNLLRKLEVGDKIHLFYENMDYVYEVQNVETYKGWNTYPLTRSTLEPVLTLQTCDPPGTTLNRLVVTAVLSKVSEL